MMMCNVRGAICGLALVGSLAFVGGAGAQAGAFTEWENGLPQDPDYFPIGVWVQNERFSEEYKAMGINLYVGLGGWRSEQEQLQWLKDHDMPVLAHQNALMRNLLAQESELLDPVVGWLQQDEPDNAQSNGQGGFGPPVTPGEMVSRYETLQSYDDTRPVYMNLGQGVAWDGWIGRGVRTNHPEDYPAYQGAADILSFDIYPAASTRPAITGELWRVGYGVKRMREWTDDDKPVWNVIEASRIHGAGKITPHELRAEAWMSVIYGSTGITYFVHEWDADGNFISSNALRTDPVLGPAVTDVNQELQDLASVINSETIEGRVNVISGNVSDHIKNSYDIDGLATMLKQQGDDYYLFTVRMRDSATEGVFAIDGIDGPRWDVHVIGEDRMLEVDENGVFSDTYSGWDAHLYRLTPAVPEPTSAALLLLGLGGLMRRRR
ncbi:MAG: PEP-CTERM sorting domain-containing protein [Phycisphaeraceae bacterium]